MAFMFWRTRGRDVLARTDDWFSEARSLAGLTLGCGSAWTHPGASATSRASRWHRRGGGAGPRPHEDDVRTEKVRHPRSAVDAAAADDIGRSQKAKKKRVRKKKSDVFTNTVPSIPEGFETWKDVREAIREKARDLNLGPTTFAACEPPRAERMRAYEDWIAKNMEGEMAYLAREDRLARRRDPSIVLEGANTIIVTSLFYWPGKSGFPWAKPGNQPAGLETELNQVGNALRGKVSAYAWGKDYHAIMGERLRSLAKYAVDLCGGNSRWYVDTGAVMERDLAERSGMTFTGKNTLAIQPKLGSGFFLGSIFTTLSLPPDEPLRRETYCGSCQKCQVACPTGALSPNRDFVMDARKCISYLTIELKGAIPVELRPLVGAWVYGCDICQEVCPWNAFDWEDKGKSPLWGNVEREVSFPDLLRLLDHLEDDDAFERFFAGSAVRRIGRARFLRNVATALGNVGDARALPSLRRVLASDAEGDLVKDHARWAIDAIERRERDDRAPPSSQ